MLTDKSYGRNNENTLPTSITLYRTEGKTGLQIELSRTYDRGRRTRQLYDSFRTPAPLDYVLADRGDSTLGIQFDTAGKRRAVPLLQLHLGNRQAKGIPYESAAPAS